MTQGLAAALRHHLDGQAAVKIGGVLFPLLEVGLVAFEQLVDEGVVFFFRERTIYVIRAGAARSRLVVAGLEPGLVHVNRVEIDDRRNGVEEGQLILTSEGQHCFRQRGRSEGAGGDDDAAPVLRRQARDLAALNGDQRLGLKGLFHGLREAVPVHGQGAARRNLACVAAAHDDRSALAQLVMQQADSRGLVIIGAEGIGTDQFGEAAGLVGVGATDGAHLVQHDRHAGTGDLPSGFRPGEAAANDVDGINVAHGRRLKAGPSSPQVPEIMQGVQITAWRAGARLETATGCDYT